MAIDSAKIVSAVSGLSLVGNEDGLIPAFGLYLTRHYADYYNRISFAFLHHMERADPGGFAKASRALVETGHICGFNTFGGIMLSQEWEAVVAPMIETREDWVLGMVAVVNALGWGRWETKALRAAEELHVTCSNSYESAGYLRDYPKRQSGGVCYLATGGVAAIMNLLYHGDVTTRPPRTEEYYKQIFAEGDNRFEGREIACRASGAPLCEWVARPVRRWS